MTTITQPLPPSEAAQPESPPAPAVAPGKRPRIPEKEPATKLARQRLSVLQLAQELGSVSTP